MDYRHGITIGDDVNISSEVKMWTAQHDMNDPYFRGNHKTDGPITIRDKAWIGSNVIILDNVTIGEGAVICAGAVVTKSVEPYAVMAGIPARKIGERCHNLRYHFTGNHNWFL